VTFRARFWPVFLVNAVLLVSAVALAFGLSFLLGWVPIAACAMPFAVLAAAVFSLDRKYQYPIRVGPAVLDGFDFVGYAVSVGWAGVKDVRRTSLCGLPYLRVSSHAHGEALWLPLLLEDFDGFVDVVSRYAGEDNPLTLELNRYRWDEGE
jgi:hypothetical protein